MIPCSAIQRLERVASSSSNGYSNTSSSSSSSSLTTFTSTAPTFVWSSLKDQDQLNVITLCDSALWASSADFLLARSQMQINEPLAVAMSRSVQLLVGLLNLGDDQVRQKADEAASRIRKRFAKESDSSFVVESKYEPFDSRCKRICSSLCDLVANRRFRSVIVRAVDRDVASAMIITDMFLATSELLASLQMVATNSKKNSSLRKIVSKLHHLLFSMILFLASVKEKSSNSIATLGMLFSRSLKIGPHVQANNTNNNNNQNKQQQPRTSVIETILDLPNNSGQELLSALLKPIIDTRGARAAVYYDFNITIMTKNKINSGEFTAFINLLDGTHTKAFPPKKQLQFLSSVYLAFASCDNTDEYFQEKKKALIRNELAMAFGGGNSNNNNNNKSGLSALLMSRAASSSSGGLRQASSAREGSVGSVSSGVTTATSAISHTGAASSPGVSSANLRVSLMCHILVRMSRILRFAHDPSLCLPQTADGSSTDKKAAAAAAQQAKMYEALTEFEKSDLTNTWWFGVQQLFEALQRFRGLVASDDLRYNNGFGFESTFKLVKLLLLDTLSVIISTGGSSSATKNSGDLLLRDASAMNNLFGDNSKNQENGDGDDTSSNASASLLCKDSATIDKLQDTLAQLSPSFLLHQQRRSAATTVVVSAICKCLTCVGKLAPTHLMRFLPLVVRSLARVSTTASSGTDNESDDSANRTTTTNRILEFLCFSINYLGKLNQASSFLRSLLKEVMSVGISNTTTQQPLLLFSLLQHDDIYSAVRKAASDALDSETILSVAGGICDAVVEHGEGSIINNNCHVLFKLGRAIVDGVAASPVSGLSVTEQLVAADATMSFVLANTMSEILEEEEKKKNKTANDDETEDSEDEKKKKNTECHIPGLFEAIEFITSCRRKLFIVLQNAGVPSIDQLLYSLNKTTWQFPTQIPLLLGPEGISPSLKQLVKVLKKQASYFLSRVDDEEKEESEIYRLICEYMCPLGCSQLRLAALVSQLVTSENAEDGENNHDDDAAAVTTAPSSFDIQEDAGAQALAKTIMKQIRHFFAVSPTTSSVDDSFFSRFGIEDPDLFLLRQLDTEGSEALFLAAQQQQNETVESSSSPSTTTFITGGGTLVEGTESIWEQERGFNPVSGGNDSNNKNPHTSSSSSDAEKQLVDDPSVLLASVLYLLAPTTSAKKIQKKLSLVTNALRDVVNRKLSSAKSPLRQQLLKLCTAELEADKKEDKTNEALSQPQICFLRTLEVLLDSSKKAASVEKDKNLVQSWSQLIADQLVASSTVETTTSTSSVILMTEIVPCLIRLSPSKIATILGKAVESGISQATSSTSTKNNNSKSITVSRIITVTCSMILRPLLSNGVHANHFTETSSASLLRSIFRMTEGLNMQLITGHSHNDSGNNAGDEEQVEEDLHSVIVDALWLSKLGLQCFVEQANFAQTNFFAASASTTNNKNQQLLPVVVVSRLHDTTTAVNNLHQQLVSFIIFLQRCLMIGSQMESRLIIRRVCEALSYLYGDLFEGYNNSNNNTSSSNTQTGGDDATAAASSNNTTVTKQALQSRMAARNHLFTSRQLLLQTLQLHATKFSHDIIRLVSSDWIFSITSCAETVLRLSAIALMNSPPYSMLSQHHHHDDSAAISNMIVDGSRGTIRSLILKWLCLDSEACTTLHETAITLLIASSGQGEDAEQVSGGARGGGKHIAIRKLGHALTNAAKANTDANDLIFVALSNWPEAQLRLKSLHLEANERI